MGIRDAFFEGATEGFKEALRDISMGQLQAKLQNAINNSEMQNIAEQGDLDAIRILTIAFYQKGDYQKAAYWGYKGEHFNDATCLYMLGEVAYAEKKYTEAERFFTRSLNANDYIYFTRDEINRRLQLVREEKEKNSGGCFVTTAVCDSFGKSDDCYELTAFRNFRDKWLITQSDGKTLIDEYYAVAPQIVANINRLADPSQIYKTIWQKYLEPCLDFLHNDDNLSCKNKYSEMMHELKKKFL